MNFETNKLRAGILGATGTVGQKFISLLDNHLWFEVVCLAASPRSAGKEYIQAVEGRWSQNKSIPESVKNLKVYSVEDDKNKISQEVDFVFSALEMDKETIRKIEEEYAAINVPVVSNNSAHRWTQDVPMLMPEINPEHIRMLDIQKRNRGWDRGFIVVKPNCSVQSYMPAIQALKQFGPTKVIVSTYQAVSGAGKTVAGWPEIQDNVIPFIGGEEEKSEKEPLKIWGAIKNDQFELAKTPIISANCLRVPVSDGHLTTVNVAFEQDVTSEKIINNWNNYSSPIDELNLPSAPKPFLKYFAEDDRPQTKLDRNYQNGMGVTVGRLRKDNVLDWKFVALSHNTIRGAAGGAILVAELMRAKGYL